MKNHRTLVSALLLGSLLASGCVLAPGDGNEETSGGPVEHTGAAVQASTAISSIPVVVSLGPGNYAFITQNQDTSVGCELVQGGNDTLNVQLQGELLGPPVAVSSDQVTLDVFGTGTDNALWHKHYDGTTWGQWQSLGVPTDDDPRTSSWLISSPSVTSPSPGVIDVIAENVDQTWWHRVYSGTWSSWEYLVEFPHP